LRKGAQSTAKRSTPILDAAFDTVGTNGKIRSSGEIPDEQTLTIILILISIPTVNEFNG